MSTPFAHTFDRPALAADAVDACANKRGRVLLAGTAPVLVAPRRH